MADIIAVAVIVACVGGAVTYIIKAKKKGIECIGCPDAQSCASGKHSSQISSGCGGSCAGCAGCHTKETDHN